MAGRPSSASKRRSWNFPSWRWLFVRPPSRPSVFPHSLKRPLPLRKAVAVNSLSLSLSPPSLSAPVTLISCSPSFQPANPYLHRALSNMPLPCARPPRFPAALKLSIAIPSYALLRNGRSSFFLAQLTISSSFASSWHCICVALQKPCMAARPCPSKKSAQSPEDCRRLCRSRLARSLFFFWACPSLGAGYTIGKSALYQHCWFTACSGGGFATFWS